MLLIDTHVVKSLFTVIKFSINTSTSSFNSSKWLEHKTKGKIKAKRQVINTAYFAVYIFVNICIHTFKCSCKFDTLAMLLASIITLFSLDFFLLEYSKNKCNSYNLIYNIDVHNNHQTYVYKVVQSTKLCCQRQQCHKVHRKKRMAQEPEIGN